MNDRSDVPALTEKVVTDLLRAKHAGTGNGGSGEHAFFAQVRNAAGFDANRTFDAVALNLWPSRGLALHVFEVKVSRSDWQRELKKPAKAEDACKVADHFWIVAPAGCVRDGELPDPWGLVEVTGDGGAKPWKLRTVKSAPKLHDQPTATKALSRGLLIGLLRATPGAVPGGKLVGPDDALLRAEFQTGHALGVTEGERRAQAFAGQDRQAHSDAQALRDALVAAGVPRYQASVGALTMRAADVARALAETDAVDRVAQVRRTLETALAALPDPVAS